MEQLVVEIGMKLENDLIYYHDILVKNVLRLDFCCITHDIYYSKNNLDNLTKSQIKKSCIRLRFCDGINQEEKSKSELLKKEQELINDGYHKVFDTIKFDFHYCHNSMKSRVQLQNIKDIGLLVYYDNPDYYDKPLDEQRKLLFNELNN